MRTMRESTSLRRKKAATIKSPITFKVVFDELIDRKCSAHCYAVIHTSLLREYPALLRLWSYSLCDTLTYRIVLLGHVQGIHVAVFTRYKVIL